MKDAGTTGHEKMNLDTDMTFSKNELKCMINLNMKSDTIKYRIKTLKKSM